MYWRVLFLAIVIATSAQGAGSGLTFLTGNDLFSFCSDQSTNGQKGLCTSYIVGIADVMSNNLVNGFDACIPASSNPAQLREVVLDYLRKAASIRRGSAHSLVAAALHEGFPCPSQ